MKSDREILNELNDVLDSCKKSKLPANLACQTEIAYIRSALNHVATQICDQRATFPATVPLFSDLIDTLKNMLAEIEKEGRVLEKEVHGVENYSYYEYTRVNEYCCAKVLAAKIYQMLTIIHNTQPKLRKKASYRVNW